MSVVVCSIFSDCLVKVRAQVMTRDESTEGWLPLAGGGLANVSIRKRARLPPEVGGHEYIIYGQRISDQTVSHTTHSISLFGSTPTNCPNNIDKIIGLFFPNIPFADYTELCYQSRSSI